MEMLPGSILIMMKSKAQRVSSKPQRVISQVLQDMQRDSELKAQRVISWNSDFKHTESKFTGGRWRARPVGVLFDMLNNSYIPLKLD
jgi:alkylated DNA nucleotide flippase Atl1